MKRSFAALAIIALTGSGCAFFEPGGALSPMSLEPSGGDGSVVVQRDEHSFRITGRFDIRPGDVILTTGEARANVRLEDDRSAMIGTDSDVEVVDGDELAAVRGSVLANVDDPTVLSFYGVQARSGDGIFRIDARTASARAATYSGSVELKSPGERSRRIDPLFEIPVAAGNFIDRRPYQLNSTDPWDSLWLEDVVALQEHLDALASGMRSQLGSRGPGLVYFRGLGGGSDVSFMRDYVTGRFGRSASDLLIAFTLAGNDPHRSLGTSFRQAFQLRDQGGEWGVVASIMDVNMDAFVAALEDAIVGTVAATKDKGPKTVRVVSAKGGGKRSGAGGSGSTASGTSGDSSGTTSDSGGPTDTGSGSDGGGSGDDGSGGGGSGGGGSGGGGGGGGGGGCTDPVDCLLEELPLPDLPGLGGGGLPGPGLP